MNKAKEECVSVFSELKRQKSILLTLFDSKSNEIINIGTQAAAPSKDYCQLILTDGLVIFRRWKVSIRTGDAAMRWPLELKDNYSDFLLDGQMQREISMAFGKATLNYLLNIVEKGKLDYLARLPEDILLKIVSFLPLEDIAKLSQTNSLFRQLCRSDKLWVEMYKKHYTSEITKDLTKLAERDGWRKLFFTNKIKLKLELRRQAKGRLYNINPESGYFTPRKNESRDSRYNKRIAKSAFRHSTANLNRNTDENYSGFITELN